MEKLKITDNEFDIIIISYLNFLDNANFCKGLANGDYEIEKGEKSFFYNRCIDETCSLKACEKPDEKFDQSEGKCLFIFGTT